MTHTADEIRGLLTHSPPRPTDDSAERTRLIWRIRHDSALAGLSPAYRSALVKEAANFQFDNDQVER